MHSIQTSPKKIKNPIPKKFNDHISSSKPFASRISPFLRDGNRKMEKEGRPSREEDGFPRAEYHLLIFPPRESKHGCTGHHKAARSTIPQ